MDRHQKDHAKRGARHHTLTQPQQRLARLGQHRRGHGASGKLLRHLMQRGQPGIFESRDQRAMRQKRAQRHVDPRRSPTPGGGHHIERAARNQQDGYRNDAPGLPPQQRPLAEATHIIGLAHAQHTHKVQPDGNEQGQRPDDMYK